MTARFTQRSPTLTDLSSLSFEPRATFGIARNSRRKFDTLVDKRKIGASGINLETWRYENFLTRKTPRMSLLSCCIVDNKK